MRTYLKVLGTLEGDGSMELKLTNLEARALFNAGHPPMKGAYPTPRWSAGELLVDTTEVTHLKTLRTQRLSVAIDVKGISLRRKDPPAGATLIEKYAVPLGMLLVE